jgi:hypothetical protein
VVVAVHDLDVLRARLVRMARDGTREGRVLDETENDDVLAFLDVGADSDGELRVAVEAFLRFHCVKP